MKENEKQAHVQGAIALCHSLLSALHQETVTDLTFDPYAHIVKATSRKRQVVAARKNSKLLMSFIEKSLKRLERLKMMNAFEMLRYFWNATKGKAGVRKEQFQFDQGSVEDQLWEEQAFYQSVEGVWVSLHQAELYHPDFYEWETIEFLVGGEVRYSSGLDKVEDIKVEPGDVEMIVERRKEYHLDPAVIFVDPPDEVEWRWVVREHSDVENQVEVCYQQRSDSRSPWTTPEPLAQGFVTHLWPKVKDVVASFWSLANKGWEIEELSYQVRLFEYGPECCLRVYNDYDCPEYLRFDYQEWHEPSQAYITKGGELGLLKKDQWDLIEAAIEKYFKEHLS